MEAAFVVRKRELLRLYSNGKAAPRDVDEEAFGCNEIAQAVLAESRSWLISAIAQNPLSVNDPNALGQHPLHLSVAWPEGMRLLLNAGAAVDAVDDQGFTPVFYAARLGFLDAMILLDEFDCALHSFDPEYHQSLMKAATLLEEQRLWNLEYKPDSLGQTPENAVAIVDTIVRLVVRRCRKLEALVLVSLDPDSVHRLRLSPESVLDHKAPLARSLLEEKIHIPESLRNLTRPYAAVYHLPSIRAPRAEFFWKAGFRDVDELDHNGLSPLMRRDIFGFNHNLNKELEFLDWLVLHGADVHRRQGYIWQSDGMSGRFSRVSPQLPRSSSITALHYIAAAFGRHYYWDLVQECSTMDEVRYELISLSGKSRRLVEAVFIDPICDHCECACSSQGCRTYTMMGKALLTQASVYHGGRRKHCQQAALDITKLFARLLDVERPGLKWLRREMLQLITFDSLKLRHTCCKILKWGRRIIAECGDEEDRREIHDEQAGLERTLEELLPEFESKYDELAISFEQFVDGYWKNRMEGFRRKRDVVDTEGLKSVGVQLRETQYASSSSSDEDCEGEGAMESQSREV
ncbi:MAG: hypothetical protein Q9218_001912 [Villophora microphyllina]